jgi:predicted HD superfamily hydrolase involved in NAD metabolism
VDYQQAYDVALARGRELPEGLYEHCLRVSGICRELAVRYGEAPDKAALAGLIHDVARAKSAQELLTLTSELGVHADSVEHSQPVLLHGPVGAELVRRDLDIVDREILSAVRWHSTGHGDMTLLEKLLLLADKLDPGKAGYYPPGLESLAETSQRSLDEALLLYFDWQLSHLLERGAVIHPATVEARNSVIMSLKQAVP